MSSLQIGYHTGSGGNPTGIGDHMRRLAAANRPRALAMADATTGFFDLEPDYRPEDIILYRVVKDRHEGWATPEWQKSAEDAAVSYVNRILGEVPPEFEPHKDKIYIAFGNELDQDRDKYVWDWSYHCAQLLMERGWRAVGPNWASNTPREESYSTDEALRFFGLCIESEGRCAVGQHLYSYENDLLHNAPDRVGRYRYIYAASEAAHGARPLVIAKEFGTRQDTLGNGPDDWVRQLRKLAEQYPDFPPACTWYLGTWHSERIYNETQATIAPVTDFLISLGPWQKPDFTPTTKPKRKTTPKKPEPEKKATPKVKAKPQPAVTFSHFELGDHVKDKFNFLRVNRETWFRFILTNNSSQPVDVGGVGVMVYHWQEGQGKWVPHLYQHSYTLMLEPNKSLDWMDHFKPTEQGKMAVQPIWTADHGATNKRKANQMESISDPHREHPPVYLHIGPHNVNGKVLAEDAVTKLPWHAVPETITPEPEPQPDDKVGANGKQEPGGEQERPEVVDQSSSAKPGTGGIAAQLQSLIAQLASLDVHSSQTLPLALSSAGQVPLSPELRLNYGGEAYLVQFAYMASGPEWRAYYSPVSEPTSIAIVSTATGPAPTIDENQAVAPRPEASPEKHSLAPQAIAVDELVEDADEKAQHVEVEQAPAKEPEEIKIKRKKFKDGFILDVPFRSQNGSGALKYRGDCGPTCTSMIIEAVKGSRVAPDDLMIRLGKTSQNPRENYTNTTHLAKVLTWHGIESDYKKDATISFIEDKLDAGRPVISLIHYGSLPDRSKALKTFNGWHFILLIGYGDTEFYALDPLYRKEKVSAINKKTFIKATASQDGVTNSHQVLVARTDGLQPPPAWEKDLPADIAFDVAIGERAEGMKIPTGDLATGWIYTNAADPWLIRKGNLVEVKTSLNNVRSAPSKKATKVENGATVTYDTKIGQVVPGNTMILTGKYDNGWAQVQVKLEKLKPTKKIIRPNITGRAFDLREYFMGTRSNVQWEIWSSRGQESLQLQKQSADDFRLVKNVNAEQMHIVTQNGRGYVARTYDSSMSNTTYYTLRDGNKPYSLWCPLDMKIGEMYLRQPFVRVYQKSGKLIEPAKKAATNLKLVEHFKNFGGYDWAIHWGWPKDKLSRIGNDIKLKDCLLIEWVEGGEQYVLSRELGYFVAWARTHDDPNSPPFSVISEINTGRAPLKPNEVKLSAAVAGFLRQRGIA